MKYAVEKCENPIKWLTLGKEKRKKTLTELIPDFQKSIYEWINLKKTNG